MQVFGGFAGVGCGGKDGSLVFLQDLQPMADVGGVVVADVGGNVQIGTKESGSQFRYKLLHRVAFIPPAFAAKLAVKA